MQLQASTSLYRPLYHPRLFYSFIFYFGTRNAPKPQVDVGRLRLQSGQLHLSPACWHFLRSHPHLFPLHCVCVCVCVCFCVNLFRSQKVRDLRH